VFILVGFAVDDFVLVAVVVAAIMAVRMAAKTAFIIIVTALYVGVLLLVTSFADVSKCLRLNLVEFYQAVLPVALRICVYRAFEAFFIVGIRVRMMSSKRVGVTFL
jgi:hypothetical protein